LRQNGYGTKHFCNKRELEVSDPLVTVVVPNFNHAKFLAQRLDTILAQTFSNFEVLIYDDASTDNSKEILEQYRNNSHVKQISYNNSNSGIPFVQWNKGISEARGSYIWIAESDDFCDNNFLFELVTRMEQEPMAVFGYGSSDRVDAEGTFLDNLSWWYSDIDRYKWSKDYCSDGVEEINAALVKKNTVPNASAVVFKRDAALAIGLAPTNFKLSGDWLFWIMLATKGKVIYTTATKNYFRTHKRSVRSEESKNLTSVDEKLQIIQLLIKRKLITPEVRNILRQSIQLELVNEFKKQPAKVGFRSIEIGKLLLRSQFIRPGLSFS